MKVWIRRRRLCRSIVLLICAAALAGCETGPTAHRIDPYETTQADVESDRASMQALREFSDITADRVAMEITQLPRVASAEHRLVLELGTIQNETLTTPTRDFEQLQRRLRSRLMASDLIRKHFIVVDDLRRTERELERVGAGGNDDLLQEGGGSDGAARYNPEDTFVLQGDFYESRRGNRQDFYFNFRLTHLGSREIVLDSDFDSAQLQGGR